MLLKNNRGFAIMQVMILACIVGVFAFMGMKYTSESRKASAQLQFKADIDLEMSAINEILADEAKCMATFKSTTTPPTIAGEYPLNKSFGNSKLIISGYILTPNPTIKNSLLKITFKNKEILKGSNGSASFFKRINIYVTGSTYTTMTSCRSLGESSDVWFRVNSSPNIYYDKVNVGIGNAAPKAALDVDGEANVNNPYAIIATGYNTTSDKRLKKNIEPINNPLEKILSLRGVSFDWRSNDKRDFGLIAQEVQKQIPEIVSYNSNQDRLAVEYSKIIPFLVEALKYQQSELNKLQNEINVLRKKIY